ncbi:protein myomaker isoform X2 [Pongo pygmaeus]|uniref:protein myomaker isoform X2 n=1 Tax=Pongo pygmaeus TaxID=9600 RepID=UPI00300CE0B0
MGRTEASTLPPGCWKGPTRQLHHACNGPGLSVLCFMRHDILEYFSVYGTALSMWVSLMALADFDEPKRSTFVMFGVLTIAVRIYHDRWGYGVYSGPIGTAILIIAAKWLQKMKEKKGLYPDKSVYTQQIGPGLCFGALALMLRFFFEGTQDQAGKIRMFSSQALSRPIGVSGGALGLASAHPTAGQQPRSPSRVPAMTGGLLCLQFSPGNCYHHLCPMSSGSE